MAVSVELNVMGGGAQSATCPHEDLAFLGEGGRASYYRCRLCGAGVVEDRGRFWVLRPAVL